MSEVNTAQDIGWAVYTMRQGERVCRRGWNGKHMWIALQTPDSNSKMSVPYVYMMTAQHQTVPWLCSQSDLLADDWELYKYGEAT